MTIPSSTSPEGTGEEALPDGYEWVQCPGPYPSDWAHAKPGYCSRCGRDVGVGSDGRIPPHRQQWQTRPATSPTAQAGEGLVTEEMLTKARQSVPGNLRGHVGAVLAAVAPDIAAQVRRQCAEELRAAFASYAFRTPDWYGSEVQRICADLYNHWSRSARTPEEEEGR